MLESLTSENIKDVLDGFKGLAFDFFTEERKDNFIKLLSSSVAASSLTALGIYCANLKLDNNRQKLQQGKIALVIVSKIDLKISSVSNIQAYLCLQGLDISKNLDSLVNVFTEPNFETFILENGGIFPVHIIKSLIAYSNSMRYCRNLAKKLKEIYEYILKENSELLADHKLKEEYQYQLDKELEVVILRGILLIKVISAEVLKEPENEKICLERLEERKVRIESLAEKVKEEGKDPAIYDRLLEFIRGDHVKELNLLKNLSPAQIHQIRREN